MRLFSSGQKKSQSVKWSLKIIFYILTSPKLDFGEGEKEMFQEVAWHWELIFFLLISPKCDLGDFVKEKFQGLTCHFELIFGFLNIAKCELVVENSMFQGSYGTFN